MAQISVGATRNVVLVHDRRNTIHETTRSFSRKIHLLINLTSCGMTLSGASSINQ